ncbi:MAG: hypothetical protein DCC58_15340 [Chloroflexi bacterium]|nr:MAG: hypothetical protein DCC58_15340 [Chloroflexota bacterium]
MARNFGVADLLGLGAAEVPVGVELDACLGVAQVEVELPLAQDTAHRRFVAAVPVEDQHVAHAVADQALDGIEQHCQPGAGLGRQRAGVEHVMLGDADADRHGHDDLRIEPPRRLLGYPGRRADVVVHCQVFEVLLDRAGCDDCRLEPTTCQRLAHLATRHPPEEYLLIGHACLPSSRCVLAVQRREPAGFRQVRRIADNAARAGLRRGRAVVRVAVEVGGTFTDLLWVDAGGQVRTWKVPSTPGDPSGGVIAGLEEGLAGDLPALTELLHGSTVATNAVIERTGCRAGLVTTRGFRDILVTQRQLRDNVYAVVSKKPAPIVPLSRTVEAVERMTVRGEVQVPLDVDALLRDVTRLVDEQQVEALAICLLHAYQNPAHEQHARAAIATRFPDLPVVLSSDVLPAIREYERASTTAIAAYLSPRIGQYLSHLEEYLRERVGEAPLFVMQSSGGVLPSAGIRSRPVEMLQSGPAAGVIAAVRVAELLGDSDLITLDIGGTSTDVCLVRDGVAEVSAERQLDGLPVGIPSVDIANVGAGGGSLAWLDRGGMLQVGPQSAGARPGPACYGFGGDQPAVTDAVVQLGWLRPAHFLGGRMPLHPERAAAALAPLARALGQDSTQAAQAMVDIAVANINRAVRLVSVQRGHDPRGYALYAFGGMGALVGALVADELRIRRVVVPPHPGLFSALGLLVADLERTYRRTRLLPLQPETLPEIAAIFAGLRDAAEAEYAGYGYRPEQVETHAFLEMRYRGQGFELLVPADPARLATEGVAYLTQAFHAAHLARYGTRAPVDAIEVVTYRLVARVPGSRAVLAHLGGECPVGDATPETAEVTFDGRRQPCRFYQRERLPVGFTTSGLAIVEEPTATTLVPPGWRLTAGPAGALILESEAQA